MSAVVARILGLPIWIALVVVFALPAAEASIALGVVVPGEVALVLGGVLASTHRVALPVVLVIGVAGAVTGDTIGFWIGRRWGGRLIDRLVSGRFTGRVVRRDHVERARGVLAAHGGSAVFIGRFTAALRALMPGLAGAAGVSYRVFWPYNLAGGLVWGSAAVLLGYAAGASWQHAAHLASIGGLAILGVVVVAVIGVVVWRRVLRS